jgi:hypothetical protein
MNGVRTGTGSRVKLRRTGASAVSVTCFDPGTKPSKVATTTRNCSMGNPSKPKKPSASVTTDELVSRTLTVTPSSGRIAGSKM